MERERNYDRDTLSQAVQTIDIFLNPQLKSAHYILIKRSIYGQVAIFFLVCLDELARIMNVWANEQFKQQKMSMSMIASCVRGQQITRTVNERVWGISLEKSMPLARFIVRRFFASRKHTDKQTNNCLYPKATICFTSKHIKEFSVPGSLFSRKEPVSSVVVVRVLF